jgi:hypothetical protein
MQGLGLTSGTKLVQVPLYKRAIVRVGAWRVQVQVQVRERLSWMLLRLTVLAVLLAELAQRQHWAQWPRQPQAAGPRALTDPLW